ncbi:hypothetical protein XENORESO_020418, partial [Xenotaenia resolanae]
DQIAAMLAVAVASSRTLEVLDLEGTGLTNQSAQVPQLQRSFVLFIISFSFVSRVSVCVGVPGHGGELPN